MLEKIKSWLFPKAPAYYVSRLEYDIVKFNDGSYRIRTRLRGSGNWGGYLTDFGMSNRHTKHRSIKAAQRDIDNEIYKEWSVLPVKNEVGNE